MKTIMELLQETNKDADFAKSEDFVSDGLLDSMDVQMLAVAIEDEFGEVGPQDYLRKRFDLTAEHIARTVRELRA